MKKQSEAVTIQDVAQFAGVSQATVSKVLNNGLHISASTRERVLEAARKLNYRPNTIARSLRLQRTATIGMVTDDLEGVFTMMMLRGVEQVAAAQRFSVFMCNSFGDAARERTHLEVLIDKQVDGIILQSGYRVRERGAPAARLGHIPIVYLYQYTHDLPVPCVIPDDRGGALLGVEHLIAAGRRRIALINGPAHYEATHLRLEGYQAALRTAALPFDPLLVRVGTWNETSGYQLAHELLSLPEPPDALFCAGDSLAIGALDACHMRGLRVPEDIALVGFDNRHFAAFQRPPLTSVALPLAEMGELAGSLLLSVIHGDVQDATMQRVPCRLVVRQSSGVTVT